MSEDHSFHNLLPVSNGCMKCANNECKTYIQELINTKKLREKESTKLINYHKHKDNTSCYCINLNLYKCENCGKLKYIGKPYKMCSGCNSVHYCSKKCQKLHWKTHRVKCNNRKINEMSQALNVIIKGLCNGTLILTFDNMCQSIYYDYQVRLSILDTVKFLQDKKFNYIINKECADIKGSFLGSFSATAEKGKIADSMMCQRHIIGSERPQSFLRQKDKINKCFNICNKYHIIIYDDDLEVCRSFMVCDINVFNVFGNDIVDYVKFRYIDISTREDFIMRLIETKMLSDPNNNKSLFGLHNKSLFGLHSDKSLSDKFGLTYSIYLNIYKCGNCDKYKYIGKHYKMCSCCRSIHYCSKKCQKLHWKTHRVECKNYKIRKMAQLLNDIIRGLTDNKILIDTNLEYSFLPAYNLEIRLSISDAKKLLKNDNITNEMFKRSNHEYNIKHDQYYSYFPTCWKYKVTIYDGDLELHRFYIFCLINSFIKNATEFLTECSNKKVF